MWAKVEDNNITRIYARPRPITVGDVNHPANILTPTFFNNKISLSIILG